MKTKGVHHIAVVTLGCSKNQVDSEFLAAHLNKRGIEASHQYREGVTEAVIINTCGFIHDAREESVETVLQYLELKKQQQIRQVFVMGCLTQRYREEVLQELPEIDGIYGVNEQEKIITDITGRLRSELTGERMLTTPAHYAYLKIAEGCDRTCAFCAIPAIRGRNVSRPIEELKVEAQQLADKGVKELILIAQDLTYYGLDNYGKRMLAPLLKELEMVEGIRWIRLHYTFPAQFPTDVLQVMRHSDKVCRYMDIPLQHVSSAILRSMRRGIDGEQTRALVKKIREEVPDVAIRTTLITGYPGETEAQFLELVNFVEEMQFERLGVFPYSHEEDTPAFELKDDVDDQVKQRRAEHIMEVQEAISLSHNSKKVGKVFTVIIDREDDTYYAGRTEYDSPDVDNEILITKTRHLEPGDFVAVKVTDADPFDLYGVISE